MTAAGRDTSEVPATPPQMAARVRRFAARCTGEKNEAGTFAVPATRLHADRGVLLHDEGVYSGRERPGDGEPDDAPSHDDTANFCSLLLRREARRSPLGEGSHPASRHSMHAGRLLP